MSEGAAFVLEREWPASPPWVRETVHGGGSQGAEVWADASGRRVVVKRHRRAEPGHFDAVLDRVNRLRRAGVPAPATAVVRDGDDVLLLHDYLPGRSDPRLSPRLVDHLLEITENMCGLADDSAGEWPELIGASLTVGLIGYCEHGSLAAFSDESRALLARVRRVGSDGGVARLAAPDLVHYDLHPDNVLSLDGEQVSGIIDWDAVRAGARALDLGLLAFASSWRTSDQSVLEQLWTAFLVAGSHDARVVYMHHACLRLVDWIIRHGNRPGPDRTIELATWALDVTESVRFTPPPAGSTL